MVVLVELWRQPQTLLRDILASSVMVALRTLDTGQFFSASAARRAKLASSMFGGLLRKMSRLSKPPKTVSGIAGLGATAERTFLGTARGDESCAFAHEADGTTEARDLVASTLARFKEVSKLPT